MGGLVVIRRANVAESAVTRGRSECVIPGCGAASPWCPVPPSRLPRICSPSGCRVPVASPHMLLMGVPLAPSLVLDLADLLGEEGLGRQLRDAHERRVIAFDLEPAEAEAILSVIDDPPPGLEELRAVLLREIEPRRAAGL